MIDFSGRAARAGTRSISVVAAISCFAVMPQLAHAGVHGTAARKHNHDVSHRDHDRRNGHGRANLVVDTKGPQGAIQPGRTYKWPYEVTNKGSVPARNVSLTATPDKSLKVLAVPPKCRWEHGGRLFCKIGLLPQGETKRGEITAAVTPKVRSVRPLVNPVQVTWRSSPSRGTGRTTFPPSRETGRTTFPPSSTTGHTTFPPSSTTGRTALTPSRATGRTVLPPSSRTGRSALTPATRPGKDASRNADPAARVPYPVMQTERVPGAAEAVVVRSSVSPLAPVGPCALILPARVAGGKATPVKPAAGSCEVPRITPEPVPAGLTGKQAGAQCALDPARHDAAVPSCTTARHATVTPCEAAAAAQAAKTETGRAAQPAIGRDTRPETGSAAHAADPAVPPCATPRDETVAAPCGATAAEPATDAKPAVPPCAAAGPGACACQGHQAAPDVVVVPGMPVIVPDRPAHQVTTPRHDPALTPCEAAARPAKDESAVPPCAAVQDRPAVTPCEAAAAAKPARDESAVPPCAAVQDRPVLTPCEAAAAAKPVKDESAVPPCGAVQGRPAVTPCEAAAAAEPAKEDKPAVPPCAAAQGRPVVTPCQAAQGVQGESAVPACAGASNQPVVAQCHAADQGVQVAPAAPACAGVQDRPVLAPCAAVEHIAARPAVPCMVGRHRPVSAGTVPVVPRRPSSGVVVVPGIIGKAPLTPLAPLAPLAPVGSGVSAVLPGHSVTLPCGAVVEKPVAAQDVPVTSPCAGASGVAGACGCVAGQDLPAGTPDAAPAEDPAGISPCQAFAQGDIVPGKSAAPTCAGAQAHPIVIPGKSVPITPQAGTGLGLHRPVVRPDHPVLGRPANDPVILPGRFPRHGRFVHVPRGRAHRGCLAQGTGYICPLGSVPRGGHHIRPALHTRPGARPERFECGGGAAACHTRMARPVAAHPNVTVRRLPSTGTSSALLALSGLGLAGAGVALYRFGRSRRSQG